jgi:kumamolisin
MKRSKKHAIPALLTLTVLTTLFTLFYGVVGASASPGGRSPIPGHMIPALQGRTPIGAKDGQQHLQLTVSLNLADSTGLQGLLDAQNNPHSRLYHQYITPQQFTARFAPSQASVNAVVSWLRSQGLTVRSVADNRLSINVEGTVATVEQALNIRISNYSLNGQIVYAPDNEPSVPSSLAGLILNIGGLDNTSAPHRLSMLAPNQAHKANLGPGGGYAPSELRTAYDMNALVSADDGTGQTVALVELDGYSASDVNTYLTNYSLGGPHYSNVLLDGATGAPGTSGSAIEVELDMEVVSAIAPGAAQKIYIAPNGLAGFQGFLDDFRQIVSDNTARVVSDSWGLCESLTGTSSMQAFHTVFAQGAAQGQAFFAASGDAGSADCSTSSTLAVDYPASDPLVVGVGGTTLTTGSGGTYTSETVWNNGSGSDGGGLSTFFAQPSYQSGPGVSNSFSNGMREVPDVSADADPNTGYSVYCTAGKICNNAGWMDVGGTSAAAPLWAGVATDINQYLATQSKPTLGSASVDLYQIFNTQKALTAYHDITTGNNDHNGSNSGKYPATTGYDMASGIGTLDAWNLARDLAGDFPVITPPSIELTTVPGVDPAPQAITIQNNSSAIYSWSVGTLPAFLSATPSSGTIPAHSSGQFTLSFIIGNTPQTYTTNLLVQDTGNVFNSLPVAVTVVAATVHKTWYFAEGYTGSSFSEFLTIENPNASANTATVQYFLGSGAPITKTYALAPSSRTTIYVNNEVGANQNVSMVVTGAQPIVAERPMYFTYTGLAGYTIPGGSDVLGATSLGQSFDFGYIDTTTGHDPYLTILNPNSVAMTATIQYFPAAGGSPTTRQHTFPANSRGTINIRTQENLPAGSYSALVSLDQPGLVERPLYLQDSVTGYTGSADVVGVAAPQTDWYFAEGYTSSTFHERYILSNPGSKSTAQAIITFYGSTGALASQVIVLTPGQQQVVDVNGVLGNNVNNSAHISSTVPILAERFMSFDFPGASSIPGATDVLGASAPSYQFYFAEGYTGVGFAEYLTIENPSASQTAIVSVTFYPENGGAPTVRMYTIVPSSRFTLYTADVMPNQSFSMQVESNVGIVAERPMYFNYNSSGQTGGSDIIGYQAPGTLFVPPPVAPSTIYIGSDDGHEYALDVSTGAKNWSTPTSNPVGTAAVGNGAVYFSSGGNLFALDAKTGTTLWVQYTGGSTTPTLVNGVLYFGTGVNVEAYYAIANKPAWNFPTGSTVEDEPTVVNGVVYVGSDDHYVYALDANTGAKLWSFQTGGFARSSPEVVNGVVYVGSDDHYVYALDANTGAKLWSFQTGGLVTASPTVANGVVYVGSYDGIVYALNASTGAKLWSFQVGGTVSGVIVSSKAAVANGVVYITGGNGDDKLYALDASTGAKLWSFQTSGVPSSPLFYNGLVYIGSEDNNVYAIDASNGTKVWSFRTQNLVDSSPALG